MANFWNPRQIRRKKGGSLSWTLFCSLFVGLSIDAFRMSVAPFSIELCSKNEIDPNLGQWCKYE